VSTLLFDHFIHNWIDVAVLAIVFVAMLRGWERGFLAFSLDLLGLVLSFLAALRYYEPVATWFTVQFGVGPPFSKPLAFLVIASVIGLGLAMVVGALVRLLSPLVRHNPVDRLLGIVPGGLNGLLIAAILLTLAVTLPISRTLETSVQRSGLGSELVAAVTAVEARLRPVFGDAIAELLTFQTVSPEAGASLELPFSVANPAPDPGAEEQMLRLVNEERVSRGVAPLVMDEQLRALARAHARDMFERGYFSHFTPDGLSPFDRMRAAGINFLAAGENLALAPTVEVAHTGLMNSPGHRRNILSPEFHRVGIGALDGGLHGIMFAQEFTN